MAADPRTVITAALDRLAGHLPGLGVALSGGGDSLALLRVAAGWGRARGITIAAATVDHALRPGSAAEAAQAGRMAAAVGVAHDVLRWDRDGPPGGNLMAAARDARAALLAGWARGGGLPAVALGHTMDDQAETLLMRLSRGAGVDGLSGMAEARRAQGVLWLRPLLGTRRADLRDWLAAQGLRWIDDPTNDDADFDRIRIRHALAALDLPVPALAQSAANLAQARAALGHAAQAAGQGAVADRGMLTLPRAEWQRAPAEIRRRLTVGALRWITGADYGPRREPVARLIAALAAGAQATLDGVIVRARGEGVEFIREPAAAARATATPQAGAAVWDNRWQLTDLPAGALVRATAESDLAGRDWRATGLPRAALLSVPAVQTAAGTVLPLLDAGPIGARPLRDATDFAAILSAH
ncbi:tRNA lysidine(34) synthetase TilS [Paracoccus luteus]|uniref:tRNA lysidine(34) synthetase TilS n=1 Tax=Paracoccus luteus TaxID=2508543 RepID=UPI00106F50F1|nr:tRNA lysidine(34) synthetase TilS [Paracoccus luteus]